MTKQLIDLVLENIAGEVTTKEYEEVKQALESYDPENTDFLEALKQAGVDNWEGYSDAWDIMKGWGYD